MITGLFGWLTPQQSPLRINGPEMIELSNTPLFDPGVTVFISASNPDGIPSALSLDCRLMTGFGTVPVRGEPDRVHAGERVRDGAALLAVVDVGRTSAGDRLVCTGAQAGVELWLLPTLPASSAMPMSVVIAGVGCLGSAILVNPGARGYRLR